MSRLTFSRGLLLNLQAKIAPDRREYLTKEQALDELRKLTGRDFGYDVAAWKRWLKDHDVA